MSLLLLKSKAKQKKAKKQRWLGMSYCKQTAEDVNKKLLFPNYCLLQTEVVSPLSLGQ